MNEPYLIAHIVSGQPAFDIAIILDQLDEDSEIIWIIPTSGHRAYPYWYRALNDMELSGYPTTYVNELAPPPPENWPDHYPHRSTESPKLNITALIPPSPPIRRRV